MTTHPNLTGTDAVHQFAFKQATDPGAVGAGKPWVDTSTTAPYQLKVRNATNTAWELVGTVGIVDPTTTQGDLIIRGASTLVRLAIGANGSVPLSNGTTLSYTTSPTFAGVVTGTAVAASGLTGAASPTRLVGATTSGSPSTGTFAAGDIVVDLTGKLFICTGAGTPGTWQQASTGMANPMSANQDLVIGGASGAPARLAVGANGQVLTITGGVVGWANSASGFASPMAQIGDMIVGSTSGAASRLAVGSNGQVLTVVAGQPGWANPSGGVGGGNNVASSLMLARTCL